MLDLGTFWRVQISPFSSGQLHELVRRPTSYKVTPPSLPPNQPIAPPPSLPPGQPIPPPRNNPSNRPILQKDITKTIKRVQKKNQSTNITLNSCLDLRTRLLHNLRLRSTAWLANSCKHTHLLISDCFQNC